MSHDTRHTNRLIHSASPYLLQHAHNPVDWFEWGKEALDKAVLEDKPILVSIGYSSCHWCHVMERESFEQDSVAEIMNANFVCIKVDREERPDIDQIYMDAVQALGVHGGWPLNVFLTPEQKPFFGGTYFSPGGWVQILNNIHKAFGGNRVNIEQTAEELRLHLLRSDVERFKQPAGDTSLTDDLASVYKTLSVAFDKTWGGLDKAPKFVMPSVWQWLLRYAHLSDNEEALDHVRFTLKRIAMGGIYDQVGGGFARYSVDGQWFAPHFEKMLYDNAQLISLYSEAYMITKDPEFKTVAYETFGWLQREMTGDNGGWYSAIDADSEGVEGKFYTWTSEELIRLLGDEAPVVADYFAVTEDGNWEHGNNILTRTQYDDVFLKRKKLNSAAWSAQLLAVKTKLLEARRLRVRPGTDDKIILSWNAMMIGGLTDAYRAFGDDAFLRAAQSTMLFIEQRLQEGTQLYRSYKDKRSSVTGFLDDYAYLIQAQRKLYEVTGDETWLDKAGKLMTHAVTQFVDASDQFFNYAARGAEQLIATRKELFDNVIPSSNALMVQNLYHLGILLDKEAWVTQARSMVDAMAALIRSEPNYMSYWGIVMTEIRKGMAEVVFAGEGRERERKLFHQHFEPFTLSLTREKESALVMNEGKALPDESTTIYVCYDRSCKKPVATAAEALLQL